MNLAGKRIVITGASSGIGKALAIQASALGATLCIGARNMDALKEVANQCNPSTTHISTLDVTEQESCKSFIEFAEKSMGGIDMLVNNAGISMRANFAEIDLKVIEQVMQVNFWGAVYCTRFAMNSLLKSKGSVIGISSVAGFNGLPGRTGYSASKFALHGFLESLRTENLQTGLHVMIVCPGFTESNIRNTALNKEGAPQTESPRNESKMMTANEVAEKVWNAAIQKKDFVVMSKEGKLSFYLSKFFPKLLRKLTYKHMKKEPNAPF